MKSRYFAAPFGLVLLCPLFSAAAALGAHVAIDDEGFAPPPGAPGAPQREGPALRRRAMQPAPPDDLRQAAPDPAGAPDGPREFRGRPRPPRGAGLQRIFAILDANGDGVIDRREFAQRAPRLLQRLRQAGRLPLPDIQRRGDRAERQRGPRVEAPPMPPMPSPGMGDRPGWGFGERRGPMPERGMWRPLGPGGPRHFGFAPRGPLGGPRGPGGPAFDRRDDRRMDDRPRLHLRERQRRAPRDDAPPPPDRRAPQARGDQRDGDRDGGPGLPPPEPRRERARRPPPPEPDDSDADRD